MTIETPVDEKVAGGGMPGEPVAPALPSYWRRPNLITGVAGGVIGYAVGHWLGNYLAADNQQFKGNGQNDFALTLGYVVATIGWLAGLGVFNYPVAKMLGHRPDETYEEDARLSRYFRYTLDHKVVGLQYLAAMLFYFFVAGLFALAIRSELLSPTRHLLAPDKYVEVVGEHGTLMMMMMTSAILGPFGNYLIPLMIGARWMAFPRLEALSFWLTPAAFVILLSGLLVGGFPTGWTGYAPLSVQAKEGQDAYLVAFGLMACSMILAGFNIVATVVNFRAPGMSWTRLPLFVWGILVTSMLMVLAAPILVAATYMALLDRTAQTALFDVNHGGSSFLWQNLFWFFGHPEVYILALPGFGIALELLPVFARKPAFAYRTAVAGMVGVGVLSFFVWQHHLFDSGINPDMRPVVMFTTELISIPTGIIYLVAVGTLWRARMRITVPMLFILGMLFNFLIGGISGVFLSDVPADGVAHGSFFVMAHFHYTIMGGYIFAFFAGVYFWLPKMLGRRLNDRLGKVHFWLMFVAFNSTFLPLFAVGQMGMPRRVFEYAQRLQALNVWVSISAFCLGLSLLVFVFNFLKTTVIDDRVEMAQNPWQSRGLEWTVPSPPPRVNFPAVPIVISGPYEYGTGSGPMAVLSVPATSVDQREDQR
jgi:cytochrome c oxidase subunit I